MFKQTLIAVSLVALAAPSLASTMATTPAIGRTMTTQALTTAVTATAASFTVTTQAVIDGGNTIQVTYSAAPTNAALITATVDSCGTNEAATYAGATSAGKVLNYTVQNTEDSLPIGCVLTFGATPAKFAKADIVGGPITATASWTIVGSGVDPVATPKPIISMLGKDQFGLVATTKANAIVDVNAGRKAYTPTGSDVIVLTHKDFEVGTGGAAATKSIITVNGNFAWADDHLVAGFQVGARDGQTPIAVTGDYTLGNGTNAPLPTATTLSLHNATPTADQTATITFTPLIDDLQGTAAVTDDVLATSLPNEAFTASNAVSFTDLSTAATAGSQAVAATSAGAWGLNGASVKVFSVPFGAEVESHSLFVSNSGTSTGALTASVVWNGNAAITVDLGNVQPKANKYINLIAAMTAAGNKPAFGRADVTFTVNAPAADITFTAGYTTAAGRANLFMVEQANMSTIANAAKTSSATAATDAAAAHAATDIVCSNLAAGTDGTGTDTAGDSKFKTTACP